MSSYYRFDRSPDGLLVQRLDTVPAPEDSVSFVAVAGLADAEDLAREGAALYFERRPDRSRVVVVVTSGVRGL